MRRFAKQAVARLFNAFGLEVRKKPLEAGSRMSIEGCLQQLVRLGLRPKTFIDVGVAAETAELYAVFKEANILLIEPLAEFEPFLRRIRANYNAQYVLAAAGEKAGSAVLNVHPDKVGSSLLKEVEGSSVDGVPREVPVVTIDGVCAEKNLKGPYVIKVDVQGAELEVLAGASKTLEETEVLILEVSLLGAMIGGPELFDVVSRTKESGFVAYDLSGLHYRPLDNALCQVDMVFVREDSAFRKSRAYATREQREIQLHETQRYLAEVSGKES